MQVYSLNVEGKEEWHVVGEGVLETIPFFSRSDAVGYAERATDDPITEQYIEGQLALKWLQ